MAIMLFNQDPVRGSDDPLYSWRPNEEELEKLQRHTGYSTEIPIPVALFRHRWYKDYTDYPNAGADGVAYWAESRILGGVVLFDRRVSDAVVVDGTPGVDVSGKARNPDQNFASYVVDTDMGQKHAIYLHPDRKEVCYRICRLTDEQKQQLLRFLLKEDKQTQSCPLPFIIGRENNVRVDPEEPMKETGIYRDKWERRPLGRNDWDSRLRTCYDGEPDYLSFQEWSDAGTRGHKLERRRLLGEDLGW